MDAIKVELKRHAYIEYTVYLNKFGRQETTYLWDGSSPLVVATTKHMLSLDSVPYK